MRIRPIWAFPLAAVATTGILFTANAVTGSPGKSSPSPYTLADAGNGSKTAAATPTALSVQTDPALGKVVVDGKGWTLYRFDKDTAAPSTSACADACAKAWPPVASTDDIQLEGVNETLVGKVKRDDGTEQVTLAGWPLYRYAKDTTPGDTNGQGVGGTWFAVGPKGEKVTGRPS
jgi:predicted lipoprotein with Yx(FWY)xxD motif